VEEMNTDNIAESGTFAENEARKEGKSEDETLRLREKAESATQDELYHRWHTAVMTTVENLLEKHKLGLVPRNKRLAYPDTYHLRALSGWADAARELITTINGVGLFEFRSAKEMQAVGPYATMRQAVLHHIGWVPNYARVYGTSSAEHLYDLAWS
jgi:hypothetical protein